MSKLFQITGRRRKSQPEAAGTGDAGPLRVFVTGATGYIGRAVVRELAAAGHQVTGMTRWAENTLRLKELGARAVVGDVMDPNSYREVAAAHDVLVHLAADPSGSQVAGDLAAVETLLRAARQAEPPKGAAPRVVIYTSGCFVLGETGDTPAGEDASVDHPAEVVAYRPPHERLVLDGASETVATAVIRPGMVFGGHGGLIGAFFRTAEEEGAARFVGDGANRWSPVHRDDVARLYRIVAERRARGIFHAVDGSAIPVAELARAASEAAGKAGATRGIPLEEARGEMGPFADALALDQVVSTTRSPELGWTPARPPFPEGAAAAYREWKEGRG